MTVVASPYFNSYVAIGSNNKHTLMPIVNSRLLYAFVRQPTHRYVKYYVKVCLHHCPTQRSRIAPHRHLHSHQMPKLWQAKGVIIASKSSTPFVYADPSSIHSVRL